MSQSLHPLDFDSLTKGTLVEQPQIEEIFQVLANDDPDSYRLAQMRLVELIERNRRDLYPRMHGTSVRIMTDREAEEWNVKRHRERIRGLARDAHRRSRIDRSSFSDAERRAAESRDLGYAALALTARRALAKAEQEAKLLGAGAPEDELGVAPSGVAPHGSDG